MGFSSEFGAPRGSRRPARMAAAGGFGLGRSNRRGGIPARGRRNRRRLSCAPAPTFMVGGRTQMPTAALSPRPPAAAAACPTARGRRAAGSGRSDEVFAAEAGGARSTGGESYCTACARVGRGGLGFGLSRTAQTAAGAEVREGRARPGRCSVGASRSAGFFCIGGVEVFVESSSALG